MLGLTWTYSFLTASWAGDAHEETDFLPIGDQEEKEEQCLNRRTDSFRDGTSTYDKVLADKGFEAQRLDC